MPLATTDVNIGKRWIVAASPTDAWAGHEKDIALCIGANLWRFISPREGMRGWVSDEGKDYRYTSEGWKSL